MDEWAVVTLGEVLEVKHGFAFKGEYFGEGGEARLVTPGNFYERGGFRDRGSAQKSYEGPVPDGYGLKPGALIVAMTEQSRGLLGSSAVVPDDGEIWLHNQRIGLVLLDPGAADSRFIYYLLNNPAVREQVSATATGTKVRHTAPRRIEAVRARFPPLVTQRRIAAVLSALDELIEINERRIEVLEDLARALYREWFVRFRFPGHEDVELVDSELGPIPKEWEVRTLGDVASNLDRHRKPLSKARRAERPGPYPYYGAAKLIDHIDDWLFDGEYLLFAEDESVQTRAGCPMLQLVQNKFWANNHTHILEGRAVSTQYLYLAVSRIPIAGYVTGAAQPKITQANLNRIPVLVGPSAVRAEFDRVVSVLFDDRYAALTASAAFAATRDLLLPRLVTGRLDVSDIDLGVFTPTEAE